MKLLAVDDTASMLELLAMMARRAGYTDIVTAASGADALDAIREADPAFDCLLLDISMPEMDGIELCGLVRGMPAYRETPIIMLTAMTEKDYVERAFRAGATDYLTKPFEIVELHERLRSAEDLRAAQRSKSGPDDRGPETLAGTLREARLSDEVTIEGVKDLVSYAALANYLTQMSRSGMAGSQVVAVKIDRIETIFARSTADEFLYALTDAAETITEGFSPYPHMLAYAGNGVFIVVSYKPTMEASAELETGIQYALDELEMQYDNGDPLDVEISIGNPIRPGGRLNQRVRRTFERAISRAETRASNKGEQHRQPNIRLVRR